MARPLKEGMDYFPHDTDASNDEKIEALRALHGNDGYAFYFILLERIYRTANAELDISKPAVRAALIAKIGVSQDKFEEMLQTAFDIDLLDKEAYEQRQVLTSNGVKKRAAEVQAMRIRWRKQKDNRAENHEENPVENSGENAEETPERKEKKSKEKKSKKEFIITHPYPPSCETLFQELQKIEVHDNADDAHCKVIEFLESKGFDCTKEYVVPDRGDGRRGKIDIFAVSKDVSLAIEIDRDTPRDKSIRKLNQVNGAVKIILLRTGRCTKPPDGIDAVLTLSCLKAPLKKQFAEYVSMTEQEYQSLVDKFGEDDTKRMIEILNSYKGSVGKRYKSDYLAILNWVVKRLQEEKTRAPTLGPGPGQRVPRAYASLLALAQEIEQEEQEEKVEPG